MKKLFTILGIIILSLSVSAQNVISLQSSSKGIAKSHDQFSGFQAKFSFDQIKSTTIAGTEKGTFSAITIAGAYSDGDFGTPALPVFRKMIAVPVGATPKVVVRSHTTTEYNLEDYGINTILPAQPDVRKDQDPSEVHFVYNETAYTSNEYTRASIAEIGVLGTMRGVTIGMVTVRPVQYNPVANSIVVYNDIDIEVIFENGDYQKTQELYTNTYSPYFANPYGVVFNKGVYEDHPDLYTTPVRMLVIANRMFEETLQPWIEWKTKKGFYMDVNYTDDIGTTASAIKTFCHQKYNDGTSDGTAPVFIVFVGDTPQVPASQTGSYTQKATDLYYATVDGDYFPDMYYSRMSAQTTQQLANQIEKILYYEQYQFEDPTYLDNVLLIAGADSYWNPKLAQPAINYAADNYYNTDHGYVNIHKYLNSYSGCYANLNNVGFANYTAHCSETSWGDPNLSISGVNALTNLNKYFVAMGNCCLAADFGYSGNGGECIGEAFMRAEKKGAAGYIGSSPSSYWGDDFHFAVGAYAGNISTITTPTLENTTSGCYDLMFRDADFNCLSSHIFGGNIAVTYAHTNPGYTVHTSSPWYYWEAYNVLGDASLMPYNSQAVENTITHEDFFPVGATTYTVIADPGSYVAISKDGVLYGVAVVGETGTVDVPITSGMTDEGEVTIVVTRNQYIPYINTVPLEAVSICLPPLALTAVVEEETSTVSLLWETPETERLILGYNVYCDNVKVNSDVVETTTFTDRYKWVGTYQYSVTALYEDCGESEATEEASVSVPTLCLAPINLDVTLNGKEVVLAWNEPERINDTLYGYDVYRDGVKLNETLLTYLTYTDSVFECTNYAYSVVAVYQVCEEGSDPGEATEEVVIVGINTLSNSDDYQLYPNPTNNHLTITGENMNYIELFNIHGQKVATYQTRGESMTINNLSQYAAGIYFVKIHTVDNQLVVKRFSIVK